jgi:hypothetical protein
VASGVDRDTGDVDAPGQKVIVGTRRNQSAPVSRGAQRTMLCGEIRVGA